MLTTRLHTRASVAEDRRDNCNKLVTLLNEIRYVAGGSETAFLQIRSLVHASRHSLSEIQHFEMKSASLSAAFASSSIVAVACCTRSIELPAIERRLRSHRAVHRMRLRDKQTGTFDRECLVRSRRLTERPFDWFLSRHVNAASPMPFQVGEFVRLFLVSLKRSTRNCRATVGRAAIFNSVSRF